MKYKYRGAKVLVALHDEEMRRFLEAWKNAKSSGVTLPKVDDPDYESLETLLRHVLRWARGYLRWICKNLQLPDPEIDAVPEPDAIASDAGRYMEGLLAGWTTPLSDVEDVSIFKSEYVSPWGVSYSIEAMLEHAVMHPIRHRFQLEELMGIRGNTTPGHQN